MTPCTDSESVWTTWLEPLTSDYDNSNLKVTIDLDSDVIRVQDLSSQSLDQDFDFRAHFMLPDQTETTFDFQVVVDSSDCTISDPSGTIESAIVVYIGESTQTRGLSQQTLPAFTTSGTCSSGLTYTSEVTTSATFDWSTILMLDTSDSSGLTWKWTPSLQAHEGLFTITTTAVSGCQSHSYAYTVEFIYEPCIFL